MEGPARVSTAEKEKLFRQGDRRALLVMQESTKQVRQRVKIAPQEKFLQHQ